MKQTRRRRAGRRRRRRSRRLAGLVAKRRAMSSAIPMTVKTRPRMFPAKAQRRQGRLSLRLCAFAEKSSSEIDPASRLRVDERPQSPQRKEDTNDRGQHSANSPNNQPQPRDVQRQMPSSQPPQPTTSAARTSTTPHTQSLRLSPSKLPIPASSVPSTKKQSPDPAIRKPNRLQRPDLTRALLDSEFEKERRQHQRRHDEKETEVQKVFAKIGRAT